MKAESLIDIFCPEIERINVNENYPGCERLTIKPYIPESLPYVKASVETIRGTVHSAWEKSENQLRLKIQIPANITVPEFFCL